jgi:hypothetical protein
MGARGSTGSIASYQQRFSCRPAMVQDEAAVGFETVSAGGGEILHRFRIVVAGALVSLMTLATYQVASAGSTRTPAQSSSPFCATAQSLQGEIQSLDEIDLETVSISDFRSTYRRFADLIKQLQKESPKELKNAFKRLRAFYDKVSNGKINLDVTSVKSLRKFANDVDKAGKDFSNLVTYLEDKCGITFESPTTT